MGFKNLSVDEVVQMVKSERAGKVPQQPAKKTFEQLISDYRQTTGASYSEAWTYVVKNHPAEHQLFLRRHNPQM